MATYKNVCLAINGGSSGYSQIHDGSRSTYYNTSWSHHGWGHNYQEVTFNKAYKIAYVWGSGYLSLNPYDGSCEGYSYAEVCVNGTWTAFYDSGWFRTGTRGPSGSYDNGGVGWNNVTGIRMHQYFIVTDTSSAGLMIYELEAYVKLAGGHAQLI